MHTRARYLVCLIFVLFGVGCSTPREIPPSRAELESMSVQDIADQVPVLRVIRFKPDNYFTGGSALRLSDRTLLLTEHQIRSDATGKPIPQDWIVVGGKLYQYRLLASGGGILEKDWAILELDHPLPPSPVTISTDFNRRLEPGTEVFAVGYHFMSITRREQPFTNHEVDSYPKLALRGVVIARPSHGNLPETAIYIDTLARSSLYGASGGAVVVKDPHTGQLTAVGTLSTGLQRESGEYLGVVLSRPAGALGAPAEEHGSEPK